MYRYESQVVTGVSLKISRVCIYTLHFTDSVIFLISIIYFYFKIEIKNLDIIFYSLLFFEFNNLNKNVKGHLQLVVK